MKKLFSFNLYKGLLLLLMLGACKKDQLPLYSGITSLYFYEPLYSYGRGYDYQVSDSANIYLGYTLSDSLLVLPIKLLGEASKADRPYVLTVVKDSTTAQENVDYTLTAKGVIPANTFSDTIFIKIKNRNLWLQGLSYQLVLHLESNSQFNMNLTAVKGGYANNSVWNPSRFKINFLYSISKPNYWDDNIDYLGTFSTNKLRLMVIYLKLSLKKVLIQGAAYNASDIRADAVKFNNYLKSEAEKGNIIREIDGSPMLMGPRA
ncbi:protein of unknown function [Chitinophaga costaii]|uniref:DUF4843 domain-containing protein n=1 Tax=Chitinophaga costaii TaxID=1335309 RepID=A0A1C4BK41_9BACT|nr:DUF4843 domain-containing protein [Chitinophaga costaii]PUZ27575.1 DUF4843 domain-containing protein [Chitinophaga costaii]SCC07217.1 protein of unknown function [Chitinophaga costaii]